LALYGSLRAVHHPGRKSLWSNAAGRCLQHSQIAPLNAPGYRPGHSVDGCAGHRRTHAILGCGPLPADAGASAPAGGTTDDMESRNLELAGSTLKRGERPPPTRAHDNARTCATPHYPRALHQVIQAGDQPMTTRRSSCSARPVGVPEDRDRRA